MCVFPFSLVCNVSEIVHSALVLSIHHSYLYVPFTKLGRINFMISKEIQYHIHLGKLARGRVPVLIKNVNFKMSSVYRNNTKSF